jgi:ribbon-helix-helix CopG family protein
MATVKANRKTQKKRPAARNPGARTESGAEVSPKLSDALADEAEQGYDLARAKRRRTGRPSLGKVGPSPRVTFRAGPELYRAAQARARREGRTMSELAREAFAKYIGA